jgi:hypothetical protein
MATAADFYFVMPSECFGIGGSVSGGTETSYDEDWLVDGRPGRPAHAATGSETWTITGTAAAVGIVAVCNHNIDAAKTITMGGDLSTTLTGPAVPSNGIRLNPWVTFTEVAGVDSVTIDIASNTNAIIIGELVMGKRRTLERNLAVSPSFNQSYQTVTIDSEFDSLMPYDKGVISRTLSGSVILTDSGLADVQAWVDSTKGGSLPTLIVPLSTVQDAWLVKITDFSFQPSSKNRNSVSLAFQEFPRSRW